MKELEELEKLTMSVGTAPLFDEMPGCTLSDKGIAGPTAAHVIEELHTPLNLAGTTYTTGTSAFQNPVGITWEELAGRKRAAEKALVMSGFHAGDRLLVAYPPLVNIFWSDALKDAGMEWFFPLRSGRDALLVALCRERPDGVIGESSFLRAVLADSRKLGLAEMIPEGLTLLAAGTPLDFGLLEEAETFPGMKVHDLYGCQEFGWLALDGVPLRDDVRLVSCGVSGYVQVSCGGLPTGDMFPLKSTGHILNPGGEILTYGRKRLPDDWETVIYATTAADYETVHRMARSVQRLKAKIVRVPGSLETRSKFTCIGLYSAADPAHVVVLTGPEETEYLDDMLRAQTRYQQEKKNDPSWLKER